MYMIEITEDKLQSLTEHMAKGLKYIGKAMQCIEDLEECSGAYGEKGRLGMRNDEDWWEEERKHRDSERYRDRYNRIRY